MLPSKKTITRRIERGWHPDRAATTPVMSYRERSRLGGKAEKSWHLSPLGIALRKLRQDHGESQSDMADVIGVSTTFCSSVETGKIQAPERFIREIVRHYNLPEDQANELRRLAEISSREVRINLIGMPDHARELAHTLAKRVSRLSPEQARAVWEIICRESNHVDT